MAAAVPKSVARFIRLRSDVNERLRARKLYRGELKAFIIEALTSADLNAITLTGAPGRSAPATMIAIPDVINRLLRNAAERRRCSQALLLNSAVENWLSKAERRGQMAEPLTVTRPQGRREKAFITLLPHLEDKLRQRVRKHGD